MIFSIEGHIAKILEGSKIVTRRPSDKYKVDKLYAVQPGRGKPGIEEGKIYIAYKFTENKVFPDTGSPLMDSMIRGDNGFPISEGEAKAEGGYTREGFEELYEKMYPGWKRRYAYHFHFFTAKEIEEILELEKGWK